MKSAFVSFCLLAASTTAAVGAPSTLYDDLGGEVVVRQIVDGLIVRVVENPKIGHTFEGADLERLSDKLYLQICELAEGPCVYDGLSMADSHMGHQLTSAHFMAMVEDLQAVMRDADIPFRTQNRLLALLAPMKRDVVTAR